MLFHRQRAILELVRLAGRPVFKIELVKWAFLLKNGCPSRGGNSFYDFVPYRCGPYSFTLAREADALAAAGRLREAEGGWVLPEHSDHLELPAAVAADIGNLVRRYSALPVDRLIDEVDESYPAYTVNGERRKLQPRIVGSPAVYTVGYEGRQLDGLLDLLVQRGIRTLVDVRRNPISRRFGFHRSTLSRHCGFLDIEYEHRPELGIPSEERRPLSRSRNYGELFDRYERDPLPEQQSAVERIAAVMAAGAAAIMCMELHAGDCHRGRLAKRLGSITGLLIVHLE